MGKRISAEVLALPYVQSIEQQVGRAELGEDTWGPHRSEFHVELKADAKIDQSAAKRSCARFWRATPGLQSEVVTFLGDRISESLSGETAQVAVKVIGDDLDALDTAGDKILGVLAENTRHRRFAVQAPERDAGDQRSNLLPQALAATGLKVQDVLDTIETAYAGPRWDRPSRRRARSM